MGARTRAAIQGRLYNWAAADNRYSIFVTAASRRIIEKLVVRTPAPTGAAVRLN